MADGTHIVFAGGGTGGHLYPAIAVAETLRNVHPGVEVEFLCSRRPIDAEVLATAGCRYKLLSLCAGGGGIRRWPILAWESAFALSICITYFNSMRPDFVVGTGGWVSCAPVLAARLLGIPVALLNPDAVPGRANRWLARFAEVVFAQWEATANAFPERLRGRVCVVGCPVRRAFLQTQRDQALEKWGLDPARRMLLVTGASQGSRNVNRAILSFAAEIERAGWQIVHLTGRGDYDGVSAAYRARKSPATVLAFTHDMAEALLAADLVVSRAGASTLAELTAVGRPSVLVPYPFDPAYHQLANARALASRGAAVIVEEGVDVAATTAALEAAVLGLVHAPEQMEAMRERAAAMGKRDSAHLVAMGLMKCVARMCGKKKAPMRSRGGRDCVDVRNGIAACEAAERGPAKQAIQSRF